MNLIPFKKDGQWLLCDEKLEEHIEPSWFEQAHWLHQGRLMGANSGRGSTWVIKTEWGKWVIRHYFRGGLYAKLNKDQYFWTGLNRCRAFQEFQLLKHLEQLQLPAPRPIAARVIKKGLFYRNDLIMAHEIHQNTMAQWLSQPHHSLDIWHNIGQTIGHFHRNGIYHSDLNAHNILINGDKIIVIDFDKCDIKTPQPSWQWKNVNRLKRSVEKISEQSCDKHFSKQWQTLIDAWSNALS